MKGRRKKCWSENCLFCHLSTAPDGEMFRIENHNELDNLQLENYTLQVFCHIASNHPCNSSTAHFWSEIAFKIGSVSATWRRILRRRRGVVISLILGFWPITSCISSSPLLSKLLIQHWVF